jgi:predicted nucleic acid-binding protein
MQTLIISDTACLILFDKIGEFEILRKLFQTVTITSIIAEEFKKQTPDWVIIKDPQNTNNVVNYSKVVDHGEASALALSIEIENSLLIFDDLKARKLAEELNLKYTGSIGILVLAKRRGLIEDIDELIAKIQATNFRLTKVFIEKLKEEN